MRLFLCAVAAVASLAYAPPTSAAEAILVRAEHLKCVVDNIGVYRRAPKFPVLVLFEQCPKPTFRMADALATTARVATSKKGGGPTGVISMTKAEVECLADPSISSKLLSSASGGLIKWPSNVCSF